MASDLIVSAPTYHGIATYPPGATYGPRVLKDYELVWIIEGDAEYHRGQTVVEAPAGSLVLCRPGATDFFRWDRASRTRHGYVHFNVETVPSDWPAQSDWPLVRRLPSDEVVRPIFRHLLTWQVEASPAQAKLGVALLLSVFVSGQVGTGRIVNASWPPAVEEACAFVYRALEEEPAQPIRLADMATAAHVSPEHLCRLFRNSAGHTPAQLVRMARLEYAAGLLCRSNYTIAEVSALCGFATPYHFSRAFKGAYGKPPSHLRQAVLAGAPPPPRLLSFGGLDRISL